MARVKFLCNSGANIDSCNYDEFDTVDDLGMEEGGWEKMTNDEKYKEAEQWAWDSGLDIWYEELE